MNVDLHLNKEDAAPRAEGPWVIPALYDDAPPFWFASVHIGGLTIHLRDKDGADKALALADALRDAAGSVLAELEGVTS